MGLVDYISREPQQAPPNISFCHEQKVKAELEVVERWSKKFF